MGWNNHSVSETMFFHQFDMQINLLPLIPESIEVQISSFTALYFNQNLSHKIHIPFHLNLLGSHYPSSVYES